MLSVPGVYKDGVVTLLEPIPNTRSATVIVTALENDLPERETAPVSATNGEWLDAIARDCSDRWGHNRTN